MVLLYGRWDTLVDEGISEGKLAHPAYHCHCPSYLASSSLQFHHYLFGQGTGAMADIRILILGSGMVAPPCVEYLLRNERNHITIGKSSLNLTRSNKWLD